MADRDSLASNRQKGGKSHADLVLGCDVMSASRNRHSRSPVHLTPGARCYTEQAAVNIIANRVDRTDLAQFGWQAASPKNDE
jgi:hypothetical protein